jgi:hypothetical protein
MRLTIKIFVFVFLAAVNSTMAQSSKDSTAAQSIWDVEIDPLAYIFKGFSVHLGYQAERIRYDLGVFGLEEPEALHSQENFKHRGVGAGVKVDYLFKSYKGVFVGTSLTSALHTYTYLPSNTDIQRFGLTSSIRTGYRFMIGRHFTIVPWGDVGYSLNDPSPVTINNETFPKSRFKYFLTVHLGWKF